MVAAALPFAVDAASFLAAATLLAPLPCHAPAPRAEDRTRGTLRAEIAAGLVGVLVATYTMGGPLGTTAAARLESRFGPAALLRAGLCIEAGAQLVLALTRSPRVAGGTLVLFGAHAVVWGVVSVALRQRIVPERLRGRVNSVYFLFDLGGAALGTLLGGMLASVVGITAPFWLGSGAVALLALATWRRFTPGALAPSPAEA